MRCSQCRFENPQGFKFCGQCGSPLSSQAHLRKFKKRIDPERRQLTVMFCDLVGSTKLSEQFDPEDFHQIITSYQEQCGKIIHRFDGYIAQYLGDGILAYFGYPTAREDDARRAVAAALDIRDVLYGYEIPDLEFEKPLQVRIGIHRGNVIVGEIGGSLRSEQLAIGNVPNVAALIQNMADPGDILISAFIYQLVYGYYSCRELLSKKNRGIPPTIKLYRVEEQRRSLTRFESTVSTRLTPLVGRKAELETLKRCWKYARDGNHKVVLIEGEAGIGKSRTVHEFKESIRPEPHTDIQCQCWETKRNSPFSAIIDSLKRKFDFDDVDEDRFKIKRIEKFLNFYSLDLSRFVPILLYLFSIGLRGKYKFPTFTAERWRKEIMSVVVELLKGISENDPLVFIVEDLHWIDPSTKEFIDYFIDQRAELRILTLLTFRPEFSPNWGSDGDISRLKLSGFSREETIGMIKNVEHRKPFENQIMEQIIQKSDGVPLFIEEVTRALENYSLKANGRTTKASDISEIPLTLNDYLMSRLDNLGEAKAIAQAGSVIGREFTSHEISHLLELGNRSLNRCIKTLTESGIGFRIDDSKYMFKHSLIQDAAYDSLPRSKRTFYHRKVAELMERDLTTQAHSSVEILANHFEKGQQYDKAINFWYMAGKSALESSANLEAKSHIERGRDLIGYLTDENERVNLDLKFLMLLGVNLMALEGFTSPEVRTTYERAMELCRNLENDEIVFHILIGSNWYYHLVADFMYCHQLAVKLYELADKIGDRGKLPWIHCAEGMTFYLEGNIDRSFENFQKATSFGSDDKIDDCGLSDPIVLAYCYNCLNLWALGYPDQALEEISEGKKYAEKLDNPYNTVWAISFTAYLAQHLTDYELTSAAAEKMMNYAEEQALPYWFGVGRILYLWGQSKDSNDIKSIINEIRERVDLLRKMGMITVMPYFDIILGELYYKSGQTKKGLSFIQETHNTVTDTKQHLFLPDVLRVKGDLLLSNDFGKAKKCYRDAIRKAKQMNSKSYELRSTISLCNLLRNQGKKGEAKNILSDLYNWFTEGFETGDLREAKSLLDELS